MSHVCFQSASFLRPVSPGFAFIEFDDPRDAEDAVRDMDGRFVCGCRIRVEMAKSNSRYDLFVSFMMRVYD